MGIKSLELEPTKENILSTLEKDLIGRNESVWHFVRFCDAQEGKCSIALNAQWGYGKTFFVKQAKMLFEAFNDFSNSLNEEERLAVEKVFSRYIGTGDNAIKIQPHFCVYYDAWSNDNDVDPILSLVYEIVKTTACEYMLEKSRDASKFAAALFETVTGRKAETIIKELQGEDFLSEIKTQKGIHENVNKFLDSLIPEQGNRLVVFVDELDRCKPDFAVQFLERIKHYFSDDRITFVFSVNLGELQHTIKRFYGEGFDAGRYLDRFFDYRVQLPPADMERYYQEVGLNTISSFNKVCKAVAEYYSFGLRELMKFSRTAKLVANKYIQSRSPGFSGENAMIVATYLFVPVIIGLMMVDTNLYNDFMKGKNVNPIIDVLKNENLAKRVCSFLLESDETFPGDRYSDGKSVVHLEEKLKLAYDALFLEDDARPWGEVKVGNCTFDEQTRKTVKQIVSMLSEYASY